MRISARAACALVVLAFIIMVIPLASAKDYYKILGVERDSTPAVIKRAFRKLSLKYHPDKSSGNADDHAKFVEINEANDVLSNPEKRQIYDIDGVEGLQRQNKPMNPFEQMFGGGGGGRPKGPNAMVELKLSLEQLYLGAETNIGIERNVICSKCRGTGAKGGETSKCPVCKGKGHQTVIQTLGPGFQVQMQQPCQACGGRGVTAKHVCEVCGGNKVVKEKKNLHAVIERGMRDGQEIVFEREWEQSPNSIPGDVVATLRTHAHARFTRDKDDLHTDLHISLRDALLGFSRTVQQLDGRAIEVSATGVTAPFSVLKVVGEGMPTHGTPSIRGDMHVKVLVDFPAQLSEEGKAAVKSLFK